jgi:CRP-like cAMP-binding protein
MRLGPGWILGAEEIASGYRSIGVLRSETPCVLHCLPFKAIRAMEETDPRLALKLHQLLGRLVVDRYDQRPRSDPPAPLQSTTTNSPKPAC